MSNVVVIIQGGVQVTAKESIVVSVPGSAERYREHKVNFSGNQFTVLNAGDNNYLPISWVYTESGVLCRFSSQHSFDPSAIEVYRILPDTTTENVIVTIEPAGLYFDKEGSGNEFIDVSFMVRVPKTASGDF